MQLRALPLVWRDTTTVQVGTDPRWAVALGDLSPSAARALVGLPPGASERAITAALDAEDVPAAETAGVLAHLTAAHLLVPPPTVPSAAAAESRAWAVLDVDGDGAALVARRARSRVRVVGLDRLGATLAQTLAAAGVGTLELADATAVGATDVGFGGFGVRDVGDPREVAAARAVREANPTTRTFAPAGRAPDLVVLVERGLADPCTHLPLRDADVPHLSVVVREASILVGPLVLPRRTACLTCLDLSRTDADPAWPTVAAQLVADPAVTSLVPEAAAATTAAGIAAAQALAHLDGRPCAVHGATLELALPDLLPRAWTWAPPPAGGGGG
ncbi:ThiF family adenylyltransferase, partial [Actinotalea sp. M2MS4P-6]|uniref:ThiF family adenylyltransferase n=1 Tax=Actinotalea sp. M2MS4P-6 TaxID=2983762 RepID=UPI0021E3D275